MKSTQRAIAAFVAFSSIAAAQQHLISTVAGGPPLVAPESPVSAIGYVAPGASLDADVAHLHPLAGTRQNNELAGVGSIMALARPRSCSGVTPK